MVGHPEVPVPVSPFTLVRDVAAQPGAERVLASLRILYGCRGEAPLAKACAEARVDVERVLAELERARVAAAWAVQPFDWRLAPLDELVAHLVDTHHEFTRNALGELEPLLGRVWALHGDAHPELARLSTLYGELHADLAPHLLKEERILFPYLTALALAADGGPPPEPPHFGTVDNPVRMMNVEHERVAALLLGLRQVTAGYRPPLAASAPHRALYAKLDALDADLVRHIHLESNILFPRARELEAKLAG